MAVHRLFTVTEYEFKRALVTVLREVLEDWHTYHLVADSNLIDEIIKDMSNEPEISLDHHQQVMLANILQIYIPIKMHYYADNFVNPETSIRKLAVLSGLYSSFCCDVAYEREA